jgi:tetratricopeptide (TPR) repeat protein
MNIRHRSVFVLCFVVLGSEIASADATQPDAKIPSADADRFYTAHDWPHAVQAYDALTRTAPTDARAWSRLGTALLFTGANDRAVIALEKAVTLSGDPTAGYNLGVAYAKLGDRDHAFSALNKAAAAGFSDRATVETDADLDSLRADPRFAAFAKSVETKAHPCSAQAEYRQFDFWIGRWDVTVQGKHVGTNAVEPIANDCALLENWTADKGGAGKSINFYDANTRQWQQTWMGADGGALNLFGKYEDDALRLHGETVKPDGSKTLHKLTFFKLPNDQVRQLWEDSSDDGKSWQVVWDGLYTRQK